MWAKGCPGRLLIDSLSMKIWMQGLVRGELLGKHLRGVEEAGLGRRR